MKSKASKKQVVLRQRMVWVVSTILALAVFAVITGNTYTTLVKTAVNPNGNSSTATLPDFCYRTTRIGTANVTFMCTPPTATSDFRGTVTASVYDTSIKDGGGALGVRVFFPDPPAARQGYEKQASQLDADCRGYCNCSTNTTPEVPIADCPSDALHSFAVRNVPPPPPVCQTQFRWKVIDNTPVIITLKQHVLFNGPTTYYYKYFNPDTQSMETVSESDLDAFHHNGDVVRSAQKVCEADARQAATNTYSPDCSATCAAHIPANAQEDDTGMCTTYRKDPITPPPPGCATPSPTTISPTTTPTPSNTPHPTMIIPR